MMPSERANTVLVVGGTGYFGRLLVEDLLKHVPGRLIIGCRRRPLHDPWDGRAEIQTMDLLRPETYASLLGQVRVAICAAGPFQSMPVTFVSACMEHQVDYIDLADDRGFVKRVRSLSTPQMTAVCTGWSVVPALSGALARIASAGAGKVDEMFIQIAPGNRVPRANSTVASLLASVGKPFTIWNDGRWENVTGWSRPRRFAFPAPVGNRTGFVVDVPDHEFFPEMFGANRVEFRVGAELGMLNRAVTLLAWISGKGIVRDWSRWARVVRTAMAAFKFAGSDAGAIGVEVFSGRDCRRACVVAATGGQRIPVMPASVLCATLLAGKRPLRGFGRWDDWIGREELEQECQRRGFRLVVE